MYKNLINWMNWNYKTEILFEAYINYIHLEAALTLQEKCENMSMVLFLIFKKLN